MRKDILDWEWFIFNVFCAQFPIFSDIQVSKRCLKFKEVDFVGGVHKKKCTNKGSMMVFLLISVRLYMCSWWSKIHNSLIFDYKRLHIKMTNFMWSGN